MSEKLTKTEAVGIIVALAKEMQVSNLDFIPLEIDIDQTYEICANNIITQMYSVPENHRETVMLATLTKLLTENILYCVKLKEKVKNVSNSNSN